MTVDQPDGKSRSSKRDAARGEKLRKVFAAQERIFALAQIGQRIELPQLRIDMTGVAHNEAAVRQAVEEIRK